MFRNDSATSLTLNRSATISSRSISASLTTATMPIDAPSRKWPKRRRQREALRLGGASLR
jgi:hypothetical protein